jgi:hypothetical protein
VQSRRIISQRLAAPGGGATARASADAKKKAQGREALG